MQFSVSEIPWIQYSRSYVFSPKHRFFLMYPRRIRETSYFRIQVVGVVYRTFISGEDGEADLERQARLSYVDFIPHYSTQGSLLGRISFIFWISPFYIYIYARVELAPLARALAAALACWLAGTPGLTSLRFLSRQFPNSVPGESLIYRAFASYSVLPVIYDGVSVPAPPPLLRRARGLFFLFPVCFLRRATDRPRVLFFSSSEGASLTKPYHVVVFSGLMQEIFSI